VCETAVDFSKGMLRAAATSRLSYVQLSASLYHRVCYYSVPWSPLSSRSGGVKIEIKMGLCDIYMQKSASLLLRIQPQRSATLADLRLSFYRPVPFPSLPSGRSTDRSCAATTARGLILTKD
jgi:hypothetical protein